MLGAIDIKIFGVVGILILLLIGYFVYLLYQDLVFLKKELVELKTNGQEQAPWSHHHQFEEENFEGPTDEEQDAELERHLASFMERCEPEQEIHMEEIEIVEPEPEVKKRSYNKKKKNIVEDPDEIQVLLPAITEL